MFTYSSGNVKGCIPVNTFIDIMNKLIELPTLSKPTKMLIDTK